MLKHIIVVAAALISCVSIASAKGERSTAFYNNHNYYIDPNGGPAKVVHKAGVQNYRLLRRQWAR
jgi:hypothetical protein